MWTSESERKGEYIACQYNIIIQQCLKNQHKNCACENKIKKKNIFYDFLKHEKKKTKFKSKTSE